jgi:peptidoglycan hydrolase CwlO-like protein
MAGSQYVTSNDRPEGRQYPNSPRSHFTEALSDTLGTFEDAIETLQVDLTEAQEDVVDLEGRADTLETELGTAQDDIDAVELDVADHETRIAALEGP